MHIIAKSGGILVIHFLFFLTEAYKQFKANTSFPVYSQTVYDVRRFWSSGDSTSKIVLDVLECLSLRLWNITVQ